MKKNVDPKLVIEAITSSVESLPISPKEIRGLIRIIDGSIPDKSIMQLNLEPIMVKLKVEYAWDTKKILLHYLFYKQFLYLCKNNNGVKIVPTESVDEFWHAHIQDTSKYQQDCEQIFGCMLHHFPYFGMRSKTDARNLVKSGKQTRDLLFSVFGMKNWSTSENALCGSNNCSACDGSTCDPNCSTLQSRKRPKLESITWS